jgi:hypothetical protein
MRFQGTKVQIKTCPENAGGRRVRGKKRGTAAEIPKHFLTPEIPNAFFVFKDEESIKRAPGVG